MRAIDWTFFSCSFRLQKFKLLNYSYIIKSACASQHSTVVNLFILLQEGESLIFCEKKKTRLRICSFYSIVSITRLIVLHSCLSLENTVKINLGRFKKDNSLVGFWVVVLSKRNLAITPAWWKMYKLPKPDGKCRISTRAGGNASDWCVQLKFCKRFIVYSSTIDWINFESLLKNKKKTIIIILHNNIKTVTNKINNDNINSTNKLMR